MASNFPKPKPFDIVQFPKFVDPISDQDILDDPILAAFREPGEAPFDAYERWCKMIFTRARTGTLL